MPNSESNPTVHDTFFEPLMAALASVSSTRPCPEFPDEDWLRVGIQRVLEGSESGRGFLQEHGLRLNHCPTDNNYFAALRSPRRCELAGDVNLALVNWCQAHLPDRLADIPELAPYECFAADGHWHKAAVHDARHEGTKMAVGHFYSLDLRSHTLRHLAAGQGWHEHDMRALKRVKPKGLRQGVRRGSRVLIIYDRAGIDFGYWKRCRQECAVYFLSRVKEGMVFGFEEDRAWDRSDRRNRGVLSDWKVVTREGHLVRIVTYLDRRTGEIYEFLTNEMDLPPGVIAELYRRRWEVEKVFDQVKNKLGQKKAWASSLEAKQSQAQMIAITHNLLLRYEQVLEERHGVTNQAEDSRRVQRAAQADRECARRGWPLPSLVTLPRKATQRSVKFVRWIRQALRDQLAEAAAVARLQQLYATL